MLFQYEDLFVINFLPNDKISALSKLKASANKMFKVA